MISVILNIVGMAATLLYGAFYDTILQYPSLHSRLTCLFDQDHHELDYFFFFCTPAFLIVLLVLPISVIILIRFHKHSYAMIWGLLLVIHEIVYVFLFNYMSKF